MQYKDRIFIDLSLSWLCFLLPDQFNFKLTLVFLSFEVLKGRKGMIMSQQSDQEIKLIQSLNSGNQEALRIIFDGYYEKLCLYAESFTHDHQTAEEITEDLFIYLWINARTIAIHSSLKNYLFRSIHNKCLSYLEKLKTDRKYAEPLPYELEDKEILHPLTEDYPGMDLICRELEDKTGQILEALPDKCRNIYYLNRFENLTYSEISVRLGVSVGTVKTQMSRALQKLRHGLKEFLPCLMAFFML